MDTLADKIVLAPTGDELTVRTGEAAKPLPLKEPNIISIRGDIKTVPNFVNIRKDSAGGAQVIDKAKAIIECDLNAGTMVMKLDPENYYGTIITGVLEASEELKQFGINTEKRYSKPELTKLLKFSRAYFSDKNQYAEVIAGLQKVRFKTQTEIQQEADGKGNKLNSVGVSTIASDGFKDKFIISLPVFKGFDADSIEVEICFDVLNNDISFWLESVGLKDVQRERVADIFKQQLENCQEYVTIYK